MGEYRKHNPLLESHRIKKRRHTHPTKETWLFIAYLSFFLGRNWLVWPHFFLRQLVARGGNRA